MAPQRKRIVSPPDIYIISLGCPRNLVDTEILIGKFKEKGFRIFYEPRKNCVAIINTCGFIEDAKDESIDIILELADLKKKGKISRLIIAGCLSQRYSNELMREIEDIDAIFGTSTFTEIPRYINRILRGEKMVVVDKEPRFLYHHRMPRFALTPRHAVYVKIQEGCMNLCSYCVIPKIRGPFRSRSMESILKEINSFKDSGAKEINLIGQDTSLYGMDRYRSLMLAKLLKKASPIMKSGWIRILYTHPAHYNQDLIDTIKREGVICKYLDLPIQHINDKILKRMNRHVTKKGIIKLIEKLRREIPNVAIRTSLIVGFPGEKDKEFKELEDFIKETKFNRLGVFIYSREEGTNAYNFPNQVPDKEKEMRLRLIMEIQKKVSEENNTIFLGKTLKVLIDERIEKSQYIGRTEYDAPDVDGLVYIKSNKTLTEGDFANVKIEDTLEYDLVGKI